MGSHGFLDKRGNLATLLVHGCSNKEQDELTFELLPVIFKDLDVRVQERSSNYQSVFIRFKGLKIGSEEFDRFKINIMIDYASKSSSLGLTKLFRIQVSGADMISKDKIKNLKNCKNISWKSHDSGLKLMYLIGNESNRNSCILEILYPEKRNILGSIASSLPEILKAGLDNEPEQLKNILHVLNNAKQQEL